MNGTRRNGHFLRVPGNAPQNQPRGTSSQYQLRLSRYLMLRDRNALLSASVTSCYVTVLRVLSVVVTSCNRVAVLPAAVTSRYVTVLRYYLPPLPHVRKRDIVTVITHQPTYGLCDVSVELQWVWASLDESKWVRPSLDDSECGHRLMSYSECGRRWMIVSSAIVWWSWVWPSLDVMSSAIVWWVTVSVAVVGWVTCRHNTHYHCDKISADLQGYFLGLLWRHSRGRCLSIDLNNY